MSLTVDLAEVRRLEELAFRGLACPGSPGRSPAGAQRFCRRLHRKSQFNQCVRAQMPEIDPATVSRPRSGLSRARPAADLAADARLRRRHRRRVLADRGYRRDRAQPACSAAPLHERFAADPDVRIYPRLDRLAWIEASARPAARCAPQHRDDHGSACCARSPRRSGFAFGRGRTASRLAMAHRRRSHGDHIGPVRRAGDAAGAPPRPGAAAHRKPRAPGPGSHGARFAYLQVVATNEAALPLYAAQGFRTVYAYEYRVLPAL